MLLKKRNNRYKMNDLIDLLKKGEIAVLPSDTVYGLLGDATNVESIR